MAVKNDLLYKLLEPAVRALGFELWGIEFISQGRHSTVRIYIESVKGINVDDCAAVSHQLSGILDVEDPISGEYTLEVSSPGLDRPLFSLEQYQRYVGEQLNIRMRVPFEGRRKFTGLLAAIENEELVLQLDGHEYLLPIEAIDKANIVAKI